MRNSYYAPILLSASSFSPRRLTNNKQPSNLSPPPLSLSLKTAAINFFTKHEANQNPKTGREKSKHHPEKLGFQIPSLHLQLYFPFPRFSLDLHIAGNCYSVRVRIGGRTTTLNCRRILFSEVTAEKRSYLPRNNQGINGEGILI